MRAETPFELGNGLVIGGEGRSACLQGYRKKDKVQAAMDWKLANVSLLEVPFSQVALDLGQHSPPPPLLLPS